MGTTITVDNSKYVHLRNLIEEKSYPKRPLLLLLLLLLLFLLLLSVFVVAAVVIGDAADAVVLVLELMPFAGAGALYRCWCRYCWCWCCWKTLEASFRGFEQVICCCCCC